MSREGDPLDLSILYDTARGFLGLRGQEEILRHALLSLMGACGVRFGLFLARDEVGSFVLRSSRGMADGIRVEVRLGPRIERRLAEDPGPHAGESIHSLGGALSDLTTNHGIGVLVALPGPESEMVMGIVALGPKLLGEPYSPHDIGLVREIAGLTALALRDEMGEGIGVDGVRPPARPSRTAELDALRLEHPALQAIQGNGPATRELFDEILALADYDLPVVIFGETGTGKELVAGALHALSRRAAGPFEAINCAAIPHDLIASALFGHERGAFTSAISTVRGVFERAGGGTIFLDEIGDMPLDTQANLLRVLQERCFRRVGGEKVIPYQARVVAATHCDLVEAVEDGRFRADLFYRLQMYSIRIRPLRERKEEIPALVAHILAQTRTPPAVSPGFLAELAREEFPGNVRELESLVLGAVVRARGARTLLPEHLPLPRERRPPGSDEGHGASAPRFPAGEQGGEVPSYAEMEREYILSVLRLTEGNKKGAAILMGIPRTTLNARIKKLGITTTA